ncbi:MAG: neutral zinc metallopeptidase [Alphaproteobacteria bacterium]
MRWEQGRRSSNIEDRRSGGGGGGVRIAGGGGVLLLALLVYLGGGDPTSILINATQMNSAPRLSPEQEAQQKDFVSSVLANTEDVWGAIYREQGGSYRAPVLVLFSGAVESACGTASAAVGPFYCPVDQKVYLDLSFFHDLANQLNAPGDFARAYVVAHEIGHHVQLLEGTAARVRTEQQRLPESAGRALSVKMELQADCYAGVWAAHAQAKFDMIEPGDIDEALNAASQIGDDRLQRQSQGYVVPDAFTHGSAAQRHDWFARGFREGKTAACNTF